jgi:hypothetical protein
VGCQPDLKALTQCAAYSLLPGVQDPTFAEMLVVFRRQRGQGDRRLAAYKAMLWRLRRAAHRLTRGLVADKDPKGHEEQGSLPEIRAPIQLRILADIPIAYWRVRFCTPT